MSTVYTVVCETHDQVGPDLKRGPGGAALLDSDDWNRFLVEHDWCELRLRHE